MNTLDYITEIEGIASNLAQEALEQCDNDKDEAMELIHDSLLHETIDSHQWVIYYSYNDDVIKYSDNSEAYRELYGNEDIGQIVADQGLDTLKTVMAYWAMHYDVSEQLETAFNGLEEA